MVVQSPRRKKNEIKITVEYVDEKDVPPETLARMEMNAQAFKRTAGRMMHEEWQRRWFEMQKIKTGVDTAGKS